MPNIVSCTATTIAGPPSPGGPLSFYTSLMSWFDDLVFELVADGHCTIEDGMLVKPGSPVRVLLDSVEVGEEPHDVHAVKVRLLAAMDHPRLFGGLPTESPQDRKFRRPLGWG